MNWPLGYVALDSVVEAWQPKDVIRMLTTAGYEAVDWTWLHFDPANAPSADFVDLVDESRNAGLAVSQLVISDDLTADSESARASAVERGVRAIDAAQAAGVPTLNLSVGPHPWEETAPRIGIDLDKSEAWDRAQGALASIVDHSRDSGVRVALESVWGSLLDNAEDTQRMLEELPGLDLTLDPSHFMLAHDDIVKWMASWKGRIAHVHLKDAFGNRGMEGVDFIFPLPGEGSVPWCEFFQTLTEIGYDGGISIEAESYGLLRQCYGSDSSEAVKLYLDLAKRLIAAAAQ